MSRLLNPGNSGFSVGQLAISTREDVMAAYDALPRPLRDALKDVAFNFEAGRILRDYRDADVSAEGMAFAITSSSRRQWRQTMDALGWGKAA